jgi:hypothetical protein
MKKLVLAGLAACALAGSVSGEARACGGEWVPAVEVDHRPEGVARAEKALIKGQHAAAAAMVIRMMPHIKTLDAKKSTLVARAQRILAVATARNSGALPVGKEVPSYAQGTWLGKSAAQRSENLEWSISTLRTIDGIKKDDPSVQTELAEALAKVDSHRAEARQMLEKLAKKDLIASPEAYAALADLRSAAGDEKGQKVALKRCEAMAKKASVCKASA